MKEFDLDARIEAIFTQQDWNQGTLIKQLIKDVLDYCKPEPVEPVKEERWRWSGEPAGWDNAIDDIEARQKELGLL